MKYDNSKYFPMMVSYSYLLGLEVTVQMAKTTMQLSSSLFLGVMALLYQINQMKPQAHSWVVSEQDYSTSINTKHSFHIFSSKSEYNFERCFKTKPPSLQMHAEKILIRNLFQNTSKIKI